MLILQVRLRVGMIQRVHTYYGGGAVLLKNNHLEFIVKGANAGEATLYWFSIQTNVAFPQDPGEEPVKPTEPTPPVKPEKPELLEYRLLKKTQFHLASQSTKLYLFSQINQLNHKLQSC